MPSGTVKFFNDAKGFGFVTLDEGGKDVFLPAVSVTSSGLPGLKAGQRISFDVQPDSKGPKAVDLKLLAGPAPEAFFPNKNADGSVDESATFWELNDKGSKIGALTIYFEQTPGQAQKAYVTDNTTDLKASMVTTGGTFDIHLTGTGK